jgi:methylenetetrahydrofolate dehydrogenase (NADP+) / methenyltetrahydrofolate cyclohydrolase
MTTMTAQLLQGRPIADKIKGEVRAEIETLSKKYKIAPKLHALQVGSDEASEMYVKFQKKAAEACGIQHELITLDAHATENDLISEIKRANDDEKVHGIIIQMPLPKNFRADTIIDHIHPDKDVEAVTTTNLGRLVMNKAGLAPCTSSAALRLIEETGVDVFGKEAVVIGSSKVAGLPAFLLLIGKKLTSMICHTGTFKAGTLEGHIRRADVLVVCAGKPNLIPGDWVKEGSIVIDVGINRVKGKTVGDVEFDAAQKRAGFITPVPGGVGPLTTVMLMQNVVRVVKLQHET